MRKYLVIAASLIKLAVLLIYIQHCDKYGLLSSDSSDPTVNSNVLMEYFRCFQKCSVQPQSDRSHRATPPGVVLTRE